MVMMEWTGDVVRVHRETNDNNSNQKSCNDLRIISSFSWRWCDGRCKKDPTTSENHDDGHRRRGWM